MISILVFLLGLIAALMAFPFSDPHHASIPLIMRSLHNCFKKRKHRFFVACGSSE